MVTSPIFLHQHKKIDHLHSGGKKSSSSSLYFFTTRFMTFFCFVLFIAVDSVAGQASSSSSSGSHYRGRYIGPITAQKHKVSGEVYAVDSRTLHIRGFTYDGTGPGMKF